MKTIHHLLFVQATPDKIWWALTEPEGMRGWWTTTVDAPKAGVGTMTTWTFEGDFNPVMETTTFEPNTSLDWRCVDGHEPWNNNSFKFQLAGLDKDRSQVRFWQEYAVELADDYYGSYNYNWGYYLESLRLLCETGTGKPFGGSQPGYRVS